MVLLSMYLFINSFYVRPWVCTPSKVNILACSLDMPRKWLKIGDVSSKNAKNVTKYVLMSMYDVLVIHGQMWVHPMGTLSTPRHRIDHETLPVRLRRKKI